jgi:hypothetical protein
MTLHFFYGKNINDMVVVGKHANVFNKKNIYQFVDHFFKTICQSEHLTNAQKSNFIANVIVMTFYIRNFRENGKGLRDQSRYMFMRLRKYFPQTMDELLPQFIKHGSWKDYNVMIEKGCDKELRDKIYSLYIDTLRQDRQIYTHNRSCVNSADYIPLSLASKWIPKEGKSLDRRVHCVNTLSKRLFPALFQTNPQQAKRAFRQYYAPLQAMLKTTETFECANKFDEIKFKDVPKKCLDKKKRAYLYLDNDHCLRGLDPKRLKCRDNILKHLEPKPRKHYEVETKPIFISGWDQLYTNIYHECYDSIRYIIERVGEGILQYYLTENDISSSSDTDTDMPDLISVDSSSSDTDKKHTYKKYEH